MIIATDEHDIVFYKNSNMDQPCRIISIGDEITTMKVVDEGRSLLVATARGVLKVYHMHIQQNQDGNKSMDFQMPSLGKIKKLIDCGSSVNGYLIFAALAEDRLYYG